MNADISQRQEIISSCLDMNRSGLNQGMSGNISVRADSGFLITPSAIPYAKMQPDDIVFINVENEQAESGKTPSSEWRMHAEIYCERQEAQAVVHAHPTFCTALSCLGCSIPAFHYMIAIAGGEDIKCAEYATFGTRALADHMLIALENRRVCLLANHGMICHASSLERALWLAEETETLARQYWHALQLGEPNILSTAEIEKVKAKLYEP